MSSRGAPSSSRGRASSSNNAAAGPSTHRFADRRQERMRGAGTQVAMQRDFQFKLPAKRAAPPSTVSATADVSSSVDSTGARKRGRPRGSGPRQKERAAAAAAAQQASFDRVADFADMSPHAFDDSSRFDASASTGVARRMARSMQSGPVSSTPTASRVRKQPVESALRGASSAQRGRVPEEEEEEEDDDDSQIGDADGYLQDESHSRHAGAPQIMNDSPGWDAGMGEMDEFLPMIPSPAPSSHVDGSVKRMRPSIAGTSVSRLSMADSPSRAADSPAARAAQRNLDARQRKRQQSPGTERFQRASASAPKKRGRPPKATGTKARALLQEPSELDETAMDRTMVDRQRGAHLATARSGRETQKRLKRALTLVFSASEAASIPGDADDSSAPPTKKRKSVKYLNDVDIIWSIVDDELCSAIEEQPAKAPFLALKSLRKSVRSNFLNLSEKTDTRTTLISQLIRARKQKRALRKEVFSKRSELARNTVEAKERQKEMKDWSNEVTAVKKVNAFLLNLRHQAVAWT